MTPELSDHDLLTNPSYPNLLTDDFVSEAGFHSINLRYPGLQLVHQNPSVFLVNNFCTPSECDRLVSMAETNGQMRPSKTGSVTETKCDQHVRTSQNVLLRQMEVPSVVTRLEQLLLVNRRQFEMFKIIRYRKGEYFKTHCDAFEGAGSMCGFVDSNRIVTAFTYLKDVERGGETLFPLIRLAIKPQKGMAVVHFPAKLDYTPDGRTFHASHTAVDEKWILNSQVWATPRGWSVPGEWSWEDESETAHEDPKLLPLSGDPM